MISTVVAAVVLAAWILLTIVWNVPGLGIAAVRVLPIGRLAQLIPSWSFFAPRPASRDFVLFARDQYDSGSVSIWREVLTEGLPWSPIGAVWNPGSRPRKALSDAATHLLQLAAPHQDSSVGMRVAKDGLVLSVPYLLLLNKVSNLPVALGVDGRQFMLAQYSTASANPTILFVSRMHDLDAPS